MNEFKPQKIEKEVISIRIPTDLLREIDDKSAAADISRNEFINQCIAFAIKSMKSEENKKPAEKVFDIFGGSFILYGQSGVYLFLYVNTIPITDATSTIGASLTKTNSKP